MIKENRVLQTQVCTEPNKLTHKKRIKICTHLHININTQNCYLTSSTISGIRNQKQSHRCSCLKSEKSINSSLPLPNQIE